MTHPCNAVCTTELASSPKVNTNEQNMGVPSAQPKSVKDDVVTY